MPFQFDSLAITFPSHSKIFCGKTLKSDTKEQILKVDYIVYLNNSDGEGGVSRPPASSVRLPSPMADEFHQAAIVVVDQAIHRIFLSYNTNIVGTSWKWFIRGNWTEKEWKVTVPLFSSNILLTGKLIQYRVIFNVQRL